MGGEKQTPGRKVLKDRRSPRERGRMGTGAMTRTRLAQAERPEGLRVVVLFLERDVRGGRHRGDCWRRETSRAGGRRACAAAAAARSSSRSRASQCAERRRRRVAWKKH
eukprot:30446-Pelagococcus_subviridis.AAC.4